MTSARERVAQLLGHSGLGWLLRKTGTWDGLFVLNYHRVGAWQTEPWDQDLYSATEEAFDAQLAFFKREFEVVGADDLDFIREKRGRYVQITFDDGYRDNHDHALPILRSHRLPATFFICTGFLDSGGVPWWDELAWLVRSSPIDRLPSFRGLREMSLAGDGRIKAVKALNFLYDNLSDVERDGFLDELAAATQMPRCKSSEAAKLWMSWDMVRALRQQGMTIGGHTRTHLELARNSLQTQLEEIQGSCERISSEIGAPVSIFSYPYGTRQSFNTDTRHALKLAGIRYAYSYHGGYQQPGQWDALNLKRVAVELNVSRQLLEGMATLPHLLA